MSGAGSDTPSTVEGACLLLVDGEHYPPVVARAVAELRATGASPVAALLVGGAEKLGQVPEEIGVPLETPGPAGPEAALASLIARTGVRRVVDLSDEPVLSGEARTRMASIALWCGAVYEGPDFRFTPPPRVVQPPAPAVAVIGTGKRAGKTALGGTAARLYRDAGLRPVVVAMGRGGPAEPEVVGAGARVDPAHLLGLVAAGRHGASDYLEDALTSGVATVGAWRAGGGMAGAVAHSNLAAALQVASGLGPGVVVLEGSGASVPPAAFGAAILAANAAAGPEPLCGYFGLYRLLLADLVVLTMCEETLDREGVTAVERCARRRPLSQPHVVHTVFRPHPLADISGKKIWFGTTANERAGPVLRQHLEGNYGCDVLAVSHALARREMLRRDLDAVLGANGKPRVDVLAVELKAAAVDVVTRWGLEHGLDVVYVDNRPVTVGGDGPLEPFLLEAAEVARQRFSA